MLAFLRNKMGIVINMLTKIKLVMVKFNVSKEPEKMKARNIQNASISQTAGNSRGTMERMAMMIHPSSIFLTKKSG